VPHSDPLQKGPRRATLGCDGFVFRESVCIEQGSGKRMADYAVLSFDALRVALPLRFVERVVRAVYLTPLPDAPDIVLGVVNVQGRVIPAVNMRKRFHLPEREIALDDQLVIAHTGQRSVALVADTVDGVFEFAEPDIAGADTILPGLEFVAGVVKLADGLILIHNLDRFLSLAEAQSLDRALDREIASHGNA
jgi:purine-binding chemotaxis protein CheW